MQYFDGMGNEKTQYVQQLEAKIQQLTLENMELQKQLKTLENQEKETSQPRIVPVLEKKVKKNPIQQPE